MVLSSLIGCDESGDILLNEIKIKGETKVILYQGVMRGDSDHYKIEIYDSNNKLRVNFRSDKLKNGTIMVDEDGKTYVVKGEKRYYTKDNISKN